MEKREDLIKTLVKRFISDLSESAKPFPQQEAIKFISVLMEYLKGIYNYEPGIPEYNYDGSPFDEDEFIEINLLEPYRDKMIPFVKTRLRYYFSKDEFNQTLLFQKLQINEALLNEDEYMHYIMQVHLILRNIKQNLYLRPIEAAKENTAGNNAEAQNLIDNPDELEKQGFNPKNKEYTRNRQVLMYYFVLKLMGISKMDNHTLRYAEFGHALCYWAVPSIKDSDLYKKLGRAPYIQESTQIKLKDLEYVKRQFENIEHAEGIAMVQKEIDFLKKR